MSTQTLDAFERQYLETALWAETDSDGEPLDRERSIEDFAPEAVEQARADCAKFRVQAGDLLIPYDESTAGHDFWLTRNGHGAGFWDGGYGSEGKRLTEISKEFKELPPYVGDDNKIYFE